jgi:serine/threonine protein kinase
MGVVFAAFDRERGSEVALKVLPSLDPDGLLRFKQEFRALEDVRHRNLVNRGELICDGQHWFFTMELVHGVDFLRYVQGEDAPPAEVRPVVDPRLADESTFRDQPAAPDAPRPQPTARGTKRFVEARLRDAFQQLVEGLTVLHAARKIHRDIKPSNVLVERGGRVVILDFGLIIDQSPESGGPPRASGTVTYMAPEQASGGPVTSAADWYSAGVVLYRALTDLPPFPGALPEIMASKLEREPLPPHAVCPGVPEDLDRLCCDLLRRDPMARPSGHEILARLGAGARVLPELATHSHPFVGRGIELEVLRNRFRELQEGRPAVVLIQGESGVGKSSLVTHFTRMARESSPQALILAGRCYEREAVPFKAFDGVMDALSRVLSRMQAAELSAILPSNAELLGQAFPVLLRVEAIQSLPPPSLASMELHEMRARLFSAIRELFARLALRQPLALTIDDLHWADADSLALLSELTRPPDAPRMLVVATTRSTVPPGFLAGAVHLRLENLPPADARLLVEALLDEERAHGLRTSDYAKTIVEDTHGHPLFIHELARHGSRQEVGRATRLEDVLAARIARLPSEALRVLELISIAASPLPKEVVARAASLDLAPFHEHAALLRTEHLSRTYGPGNAAPIEPYHDRIRQVTLLGLVPDRKRECHERLAEALEAAPDADFEALALHFGEAGHRGKAEKFATLAAEQAERALAFDRAADMFRRALSFSDDDAAVARVLRVRLGDALGNAGRGPEAGEAYLQASAGATREEALELTRRAAQQLLQSGCIEAGLAASERVLRALGMRLASTPWGALLALLGNRARLRLRGLDFQEQREIDLAPDTLQRIDASWSIAIGLAMIDNIRGADFQARNLLLALEAGEPLRIVRALASEATLVASTGKAGARRALRLLEAAERLTERLKAPVAVGFTRLCSGTVAFLQGLWREAREQCDTAEAIFVEQPTGGSYELTSAQLFSTWSLFFLGEIAELVTRAPRLAARAEERGDLYGAAGQSSGLANVAWLAMGDVDQARRRIEDAERRFPHRTFLFQHYWNLVARAQLDLYLGSGPSAYEGVANTWRSLDRSLFLRVQNIRIEARTLRGRCALAAAVGSETDARMGLAERDARAVEHEATVTAVALAALLRAGIAARRRLDEVAREELTRARVGFERAGMAIHAEVCRRREGELRGGDDGKTLVAAADRAMLAQRIHDPTRFAAMLAPGFPE